MSILVYCSFIAMQFINYDPKTRTRNNGYEMRECCNETEIQLWKQNKGLLQFGRTLYNFVIEIQGILPVLSSMVK